MNDEFKEYLTIIQTAKAVGCSRRTLYRVIERIGTTEIVTLAFGRRLVHESKVAAIKAAYMPLGSKKHSIAAKRWGSAGGTQKRINRERAARKS
jgi:AraC-like DNA-binding protein